MWSAFYLLIDTGFGAGLGFLFTYNRNSIKQILCQCLAVTVKKKLKASNLRIWTELNRNELKIKNMRTEPEPNLNCACKNSNPTLTSRRTQKNRSMGKGSFPSLVRTARPVFELSLVYSLNTWWTLHLRVMSPGCSLCSYRLLLSSRPRWSQLRVDFDSTAVRLLIKRSLRSQWRNTWLTTDTLDADRMHVPLYVSVVDGRYAVSGEIIVIGNWFPKCIMFIFGDRSPSASLPRTGREMESLCI